MQAVSGLHTNLEKKMRIFYCTLLAAAFAACTGNTDHAQDGGITEEQAVETLNRITFPGSGEGIMSASAAPTMKDADQEKLIVGTWELSAVRFIPEIKDNGGLRVDYGSRMIIRADHTWQDGTGCESGHWSVAGGKLVMFDRRNCNETGVLPDVASDISRIDATTLVRVSPFLELQMEMTYTRIE